MKIKSFMAMLLAAATMTCFTACDNDDDNENKNEQEQTVASEINGTYTGNATISMNDIVAIEDPEYTVTVTDGEDITVTLGALKYSRREISAFSVEGIKVSKGEKGVYSFEVAETSAAADLFTLEIKDVKCEIKDEVMTFTASVKIAMMPAPLVINFKSTKYAKPE